MFQNICKPFFWSNVTCANFSESMTSSAIPEFFTVFWIRQQYFMWIYTEQIPIWVIKHYKTWKGFLCAECWKFIWNLILLKNSNNLNCCTRNTSFISIAFPFMTYYFKHVGYIVCNGLTLQTFLSNSTFIPCKHSPTI